MASKHPVSQLQGYNSEPLNSVSVNTSGNLLAGGTDKVGEDASIYLWDIRMSRDVVGQFTQAHSDDITQCFFRFYLVQPVPTILRQAQLTDWCVYMMFQPCKKMKPSCL